MEKSCPECGSTNLGKGRFSNEADLHPLPPRLGFGSTVTCEVCTDCGLIINHRVDQPHKFKKK